MYKPDSLWIGPNSKKCMLAARKCKKYDVLMWVTCIIFVCDSKEILYNQQNLIFTFHPFKLSLSEDSGHNSSRVSIDNAIFAQTHQNSQW